MSRSGYDEGSGDPLELGRWRAQVESAIRDKHGQRFFLDLIAALNALPKKKLINNELEQKNAYSTLDTLDKHHGMDLTKLDIRDWEEGDWDKLGGAFNIASQLAQETMHVNDDCDDYYRRTVTDEERWRRVREWAVRQLKSETLLPPETETP